MAGVDVAALDLLGRDVVDRAHQLAGLGQVAALVAGALGQPEVGQVRTAPSISTLPGLTSRWISAMLVRGVQPEAIWRQTSIAR